jgi:hypothetical protein
MKEYIDYSGGFDPSFNFDNLNKETLVALLKLYGKYLLRIDGFWYLSVKDKFGNDGAFACDVEVWERLQPWEVKVFSELLNIRGDDVTAVMKYMQICPWIGAVDFDIDLQSPKYGVITMTHCPTLLSLEKEGSGREKLICQGMEPKIMNIIAHHFNPEIAVTPVKIPPRTDYNDCCCQWAFELNG